MTDDGGEADGTSRSGWPQRLRWWLRREPHTAEELREVLRAAERAHLIDPDTLAMMEGALQVQAMHVRDIMVPRPEMVALSEDDPPEAFVRTIVASGHSRFPVLDDKGERVVGILLAKDMLAWFAEGAERRFELKDLLRPAVFVPESKRLSVLLREFRTSRNHMAIVVDEYGQIAGLVTIEDVLEQIVGDIGDEHDVAEEAGIRPHGPNRFTVKASTPIEEFDEHFGTRLAGGDYETIGGYVLSRLGHLPRQGEELVVDGLRLRVLRADPRRIRSLLVQRLPRPPHTPADE